MAAFINKKRDICVKSSMYLIARQIQRAIARYLHTPFAMMHANPVHVSRVWKSAVPSMLRALYSGVLSMF